MAFLVEDETGLAAANSYGSVAEFKAYHDERGNSYAGFADDTAIEQGLVKATDYIESLHSRNFKGNREFPETPQALSFPRLNLYNNEGYLLLGVPTVLKSAQFEYALRTNTVTLLPDPEIDATGRTTTREKIGPIETEFSGDAGVTFTVRPYPAADFLLADLLNGSGGGVIRG